jgi:predicted kinase
MPICILPIGPAGCGKTTYYKQNYSNFTRISPDAIRFRILNYPDSGIDFDPLIEPYVWKLAYQEIDKCVADGLNFYLDCTNLTYEKRFMVYAHLSLEYKIHLIVFDLPLDQIQKQNAERKRVVDPLVITNHFKMIQRPNWFELKMATHQTIK